jgi:hypothetical protein
MPSYRTFILPISPPRNQASRTNPYISPRRNEITGLGLQALEARDELAGYARIRYDSAAAKAQQSLIDFAQELQEDDLHTRMPDIVPNSGWNRRFKAHDKTKRRLMTGAEASERNTDDRKRATNREAQETLESRPAPSSLLLSPPPRRSLLVDLCDEAGDREEEQPADDDFFLSVDRASGDASVESWPQASAYNEGIRG